MCAMHMKMMVKGQVGPGSWRGTTRDLCHGYPLLSFSEDPKCRHPTAIRGREIYISIPDSKLLKWMESGISTENSNPCVVGLNTKTSIFMSCQHTSCNHTNPKAPCFTEITKCQQIQWHFNFLQELYPCSIDLTKEM